MNRKVVLRKAKVRRKTNETDVNVELNLDGTGNYSVDTSIPFLDHMLSLTAKHGLLDLKIKAKGDTEIDYHHLIEDIGITLGETISKAVGNKKGILRYGNAEIPMDESLASVAMDLGGRPYLIYKLKLRKSSIKDLDLSLFEDFFKALSNNAMMNLHIILHYGRDPHHIFEAVFKAFGKALSMAANKSTRIKGLPTTKGKL